MGAAEVSGGGYWRAGVFGTDSNGEVDAVYGRSAVKNLHGSNIFNFIFDDVVIPSSEGRIAILGCRIDSDGESGSDSRSAHLREGTESDSSPDSSYDNGPDDFSRVHHSRYEHAFPEVGDGRHDHGETTVRGDIKIFYTITYDHGNLVGDGNVGVGHIDSGSADDGDVLTADGSGGAAFEAPTGGGGGGGTDTTISVDAVVLDYTTATRTLEVDIQQDNGTDVQGSVAFPMATAAAAGLTQYATNAEATTGTATNRSLNPSNLASIAGTLITDTAINVTSPASESTFSAASRQAVAEAISANSGGGGGGTSIAVDGVVVGYVAGTRTLGVEVEQDNGTDVAGTTVLPLVTGTDAGLIPPGRACPDPTTGTAGQVCTVNAAEDGYELAGGGDGPAPVILLDARAIPTGSGATQVTLAGGSLTDAQVLGFKVVGSSGSISYATALAADIRALTVQATTPVTATTNSLALRIQGLNQATINNVQTNVLRVWYADDDTLYVAQARGVAHSLTITALPVAGAAATGGQQASSGLRTTQIFDRDAAAAPLTVYPLGTALSAGNDNHFTFTEVDKESVAHVELMILVAAQYYLPISITREMLALMTPQAGHPGTINNTEDCGCYYVSGRTIQSADSREPPLIDPLWAFVDNRRLASRYGIVIWLDDNPAGTDWRGLHIYGISGQEMHIAAGYVYHF